jgi:TIR domain-containing protein
LSFDAFISYSSKDKPVADAVCARLESAGIRCWIAPRDVLAGTSYGEAIIDAIHAAKVMVLVFSSNANTSGHIPKEVERAVSNGLAILPFRIEDVAPGKSLDYFIGSVHWLDAMTPPLEKHLDDLVATVQKLLPTRASAQGVPVVAAREAPPRNAPAETIAAATAAATRASAAPPAAPNMMWIGLAGAALLVVIVLAVVLLRGGHDSPSQVSTSPVPSPNFNPVAAPSPASPPVTTAPAIKKNTDAIVGCYQWFNNQPVVIHANGTMSGGPFTAHWRLVNAAQREYTFTWPEAVDTVTISPDQQSLSGANQYGFPASGARISGSGGLVGVWRWPNGVPVVVAPSGIFTAATFHGRWQATDPARGIYALTWPNPVDSVTLSADGSRVSGTNQYGVAISGVKTQPCLEN